MLGKLIRYDFRALARVLFPLQIGVISGGLLATVLVGATIRLSAAHFENVSALLSGLFITLCVTLSVLIAIAIAASAFVTFLFVCLHFYRNFLGDEGYLTFTLPTTTGKLLWSKLITGMLWILINLAVIFVTILIFAVFGTASQGVMNMSVLAMISDIANTVLSSAKAYVSLPLVMIGVILAFLAGLAAQLLEWYFAIVVGGQIAKKHRVLAAIGMYLLINFGVGMITSIFSSFVMFGEGVWRIALNTFDDVGRLATASFGWSIVLSVGLGVLFFLLSRSILKKNLNLQ